MESRHLTQRWSQPPIAHSVPLRGRRHESAVAQLLVVRHMIWSRMMKIVRSTSKLAYYVLLLIGVLIAIEGVLSQRPILHDFRVATASTMPGTEIRPMGVTFQLGLISTAAAILGFCCFLPAVLLGLRARFGIRWVRVTLAVVVFALSLVPFFLGRSQFLAIVHERGLILAE
jgi:hypothetical protein